MKTTLDLDDELLLRAKARAVMEGTSLTRLIEEGLVLRLRRSACKATPPPPCLRVYPGKGGLVPGVDPLSHRALLDAAEDDT